MKTTHELARELLALPDVPVLVELWCGWHNPTAVMSGCDPEGTAFIVNRDEADPLPEEAAIDRSSLMGE